MSATSAPVTSGVPATERFRFHRRRLAELMFERDLVDSALATRAGVSRFTVHRARTGRQAPSFVAAAAIADALGISVDLLVERIRETP